MLGACNSNEPAITIHDHDCFSSSKVRKCNIVVYIGFRQEWNVITEHPYLTRLNGYLATINHILSLASTYYLFPVPCSLFCLMPFHVQCSCCILSYEFHAVLRLITFFISIDNCKSLKLFIF